MFLPGAGGDREFWRPVADRLPAAWETLLLNWPGAGCEPHDPSMAGLDDMVAWTARHLGRGTDVVAQSMGGVIAVRVAFAYPALVCRLVLVATSGGVDIPSLGGLDWREEYRRRFPRADGWIVDEQQDVSEQIKQLALPTLLLWGMQTRRARSASASTWPSCCPMRLSTSSRAPRTALPATTQMPSRRASKSTSAERRSATELP